LSGPEKNQGWRARDHRIERPRDTVADSALSDRGVFEADGDGLKREGCRAGLTRGRHGVS